MNNMNNMNNINNMNICILDLGDHYIISVINNESYEVAKHLYSLIGISINEISTNVIVNKEILHFIYESIGRVLPYSFHENINLPLKLQIDISKIVEFVTLRKFWESLENPLKKYENN